MARTVQVTQVFSRLRCQARRHVHRSGVKSGQAKSCYKSEISWTEWRKARTMGPQVGVRIIDRRRGASQGRDVFSPATAMSRTPPVNLVV